MAYFDSEWWDALETGVAKLTRAVRTSFENDEGAAVLRRLMSGGGESPPAVARPAETVAETPKPVPAKSPDPALVDSVLRVGDNGPLTVRAREDASWEPLPDPEPLRGPRVIAEAQPPGRDKPETDLPAVARHVRLKARAARWQAERSDILDAGGDAREGDARLIDEGRDSDCWLWMINPARWQDRGSRAYAAVARCYDALADAAELMALADELGREQEPAVALLAEAQSAVRAMMAEESFVDYDSDQEWVFHWLKGETDRRGIFLERHMRLDDPADPAEARDLLRRIGEARDRLTQLDKKRRGRDNLYGKIAYALKKLAGEGGEGLFPADHAQVRSLEKAVAGLLADGVPASDKRLREMLVPAVGRLPEEVGPEFARVLEEVDAHLDRQHAEAERAESGDDSPQDELLARARELTRGRRAVLIGGIPDGSHRARLERDLALDSLNWIRVSHGDSFESAAVPSLTAEGVSLAMVMTRWRSHRDGPAARSVCRDRGIALVELPGGYGSRRVAHELLAQASEKLARAGDA